MYAMLLFAINSICPTLDELQVFSDKHGKITKNKTIFILLALLMHFQV